MEKRVRKDAQQDFTIQGRLLRKLLLIFILGIGLFWGETDIASAHTHSWSYTYFLDDPNDFMCSRSCTCGATQQALNINLNGLTGLTITATDNVGTAMHAGWNTYWYTTGTTAKVTISGSNGYTYTLINHYTEQDETSGSGSLSFSKYMDGTNVYSLSATANKYTVTYYGNGNTSGSTESNTATYNQAFLTTQNGYSRTGYTFNGWNESADGKGTIWGLTSAGVYESGVSWMWNYTADITLYAQWKQNEYTVTYDANGGTTGADSYTAYYKEAVDLSPKAEKNGYTFVGWSTDPNATRPMKSFSMPDLATSSNTDYSSDWELTLYAVYTIPVSDVANHTYPDYKQEKEEEVYFVVWEEGNTSNFKSYPLTYQYDVNTMVYKYTLDTTNVSSFVSGMSNYCYQIIAYDNAGNHAVLYEGTSSSDDPVPPSNFPVPQRYLQTVNHYQYDSVIGDWIKFDTTTELVLEGETYTPSYLTPPAGYNPHDITYPTDYVISDEGSYVVKEAAISSAFYMPMNYKVTFDANGGTCDVTEKNVTYNDYYGELPVATREGHTFIGWYTQKEGGTQVLSSHKYLVADNSTLYAHWEVNPYTVTYDYWTNGGSKAFIASDEFDYNSSVDLSVTAYKEGWTFVGWNTDSQAIMGLSSMSMPAHNVTLYAIYEKDITLTIVEQTDSGQKTRSMSKTIYNTECSAVFPMEKANEWTNWTLLGWTTETGAEESPIVGIGNEYETSESNTLYGLYTSSVTVSYDSKGSSMVIDDQTKDCYYNASGDSFYPEFIIVEGLILSQYSFSNWQDSAGNVYTPGSRVIFDQNMHLTAIWDKHPEIEAYDRYFTLEQATNGDITQSELLEKVVGTDLEDGVLVNGVDVVVKDYNAYLFTSLDADTEIEITYQATDSFGNAVTKTITVSIADTTAKKSTTKKYVRFISSQFFADSNGKLLSSAQGGLEETSIWRINTNYFDLLQRTLHREEKQSKP